MLMYTLESDLVVNNLIWIYDWKVYLVDGDI